MDEIQAPSTLFFANEGFLSEKRRFLVRSPGFEPGSSAWEADVLARLDYDRLDPEILSHYY
jgi:hypothetical protein